jgi:hypothetical protein
MALDLVFVRLSLETMYSGGNHHTARHPAGLNTYWRTRSDVLFRGAQGVSDSSLRCAVLLLLVHRESALTCVYSATRALLCV